MTRDRTIMAMQHKREQGGVVGTPPLGFSAGEDGMLVPKPQEQEALERMKALRAQGLSVRQIAHRLNEEAYVCRGKAWHKTSVHRWLKSL